MGMIGNSLAQGLISGANIQDGTVDTPDLKDSAVTAAKIASAVITPAKLSTGALTWNSSGHHGIGVSPSAWSSAISLLQFGPVGLINSVAGVTNLGSNYYFDGTNLRYVTSSLASLYSQDMGDHKWYTAPSGTAGNTLTLTQMMTLSNTGALGVGITPNSWGSIFRAIQLGADGTFLAGRTDSAAQFQLGVNGYYNGTNWIRVKATPASRYMQSNGQHYWDTATSSTAGSTISFVTQLMLDTTGFLGLNEGSPDAAITITRDNVPSKGQIKINSADYGQISFWRADKTTAMGSIYMDTSSGGASGMYLTTSNAGSGAGPITISVQNGSGWRFNTAGNLQALGSNAGIQFNKSGALVNSVLNDYEVGTWTPTVSQGGNTFTVDTATYTKIGRTVIAQCYGAITAGSSALDFEMGGLPFTCISGGFSPSIVDIGNYGVVGAFARVSSGGTTIQFLYPSGASGVGRLPVKADRVAGYIIFTVVYNATS